MTENHENLFDDDGYPTEKSLDRIANWNYNDANECFNFIYSLWEYPNYYQAEETVNDFGDNIVRISLSTGGWSGNEDIIEALQKNTIIWITTWQSSRRGGHYVFEIRK